jgi:putative methyltransferase (TIGR04325 family)
MSPSAVPTNLEIIPVVIFAYARPAHLRRVLACLQKESVPLIYAFADGAKAAGDADTVAEVRRLLKEIDWCEVRLVEREENLGLGANVLAGVGEVAARHEAFVVWEDDLICVPGTYAWVCAALRHYANDTHVLSVTAWTHPEITPAGVVDQPYFDRRAECWVWGGFARSWVGMERTAREKIAALEARGVSAGAYGADLPRMARVERRRNIWAVRWLYHHLERDGLCLRPPWSLVEHIGFDEDATNAAQAERWRNPALREAPPIPAVWPEPVEQRECQALWQTANPPESLAALVKGKASSAGRRGLRLAKALGRRVVPERVLGRLRVWWGWKWFRGDYATWAEARAASGGYADGAILDRVLSATLAVQRGQAAFERDGVLFYEPMPDEPLLTTLAHVPRGPDGLRVLDFGGSLGSTYWRLRSHVPDEAKMSWDVVEQSAFVEVGKKHVASGRLRFFSDVYEAEEAGRHDVLLCSCVLQYLEDPLRALAEWRVLSIPYLLLYNVPLHTPGPDLLRVQHVPPVIYPASYPVWFFNREKFLARLEPDYDVVSEFPSEAVWSVDRRMYPSTGLLLKRKAGVNPL